ncbi:type II 3-dehydroquinate dehydratase [Jatrophihabitans fulvus]
MSQSRVLVLNGPNLGRLGGREPEIYGSGSHDELVALCTRGGAELGLDVEVRQTDHEGELLAWLHEATDAGTSVVLNAAGLTHTSVVLGDACAMLVQAGCLLVEMHISNVFAREPFRHHSYVSPHASGVLAGLGVDGYVLALSWLSTRLGDADEDAPLTD